MRAQKYANPPTLEKSMENAQGIKKIKSRSQTEMNKKQ